jgi:membrane peptidoglycan carboxypeptidase
MATSKHYGAGRGETEQPVFTKSTAFGASTFKLFPLLAALSTGVPSSWQLTTAGSFGSYATKNCSPGSTAVNGDANVFYNQTESLATATAKSSNTFYVGLADQLFNCNLQPIVDVMGKLGMTSMQLHDPRDNPKLTYAQNVVFNQRAQELVLGSIPTSPLEIAGAYAAVANGGKYNAPTPVTAIEDSKDNAIPVKRDPAVQAIAPQVAAQAAQILSQDTTGVGTSASVFSGWYTHNPSVVAGKTGTAQANSKKNAAVWFVGMTPRLVGAAAVIDFDNPFAPSRDLVGQGVGTAYGDFAAKVWLHALQPSLSHSTWSWPDPNSVPGNDVPDVTGMGLSAARSMLAQYGYKLSRLAARDNLLCPSSEPFDTVAYFGPERAPVGSTITVCVSSGVGQTVVIPHIVVPPPTHPPGNGGGGAGHRGGGSSPSPTPTPNPTHGHGHGHGGA